VRENLTTPEPGDKGFLRKEGGWEANILRKRTRTDSKDQRKTGANSQTEYGRMWAEGEVKKRGDREKSNLVNGGTMGGDVKIYCVTGGVTTKL